MKFNTEDLRSFLAEVENRQKLQRISKPVDIADEIPALCSETQVPTLFENLKNYDNWQLADCLLRDRQHQSTALKCHSDKVISHYAELTSRGPGETGIVSDSPVKEVVWTGDNANLNKLPVPIPAEGITVPDMNLKPADFATPVISGSIAVTKNPETGTHNCFFTMAKVENARRAHCYIFSPHTWENIRAYQERGEKAPLALVIGCHPIYELAAVYTGPHPGFSELQLAAAMLGEPIALVNCETIDLQVPANAEIIIEGTIDPKLGRYIHTSAHTDTHAPLISNEPYFDVTAITMRGEPIYRHIQPTRFTDHHAIAEFIISPMLLNILRGKGLDVHDIAVPLQSGINCAVIQMTARAREEAREALLNGMAMPFFPRLTIVVDKDVNIYDMSDVMYALSIRVDPSKDIMTVDDVRSFNLEPIAVPISGMEEGLLRSGSRYGIDASKPPLSQPHKRAYFERLKARGEGKVFLKDYL